MDTDAIAISLTRQRLSGHPGDVSSACYLLDLVDLRERLSALDKPEAITAALRIIDALAYASAGLIADTVDETADLECVLAYAFGTDGK